MSLTPLLDFFLPRLCSSCNEKLLPHEDTICTVCFKTFHRPDDEFLLSQYDLHFRNKGFISEFKSLFLFEKDKAVQNAIHSLKYGKKFGTGIFLGKKIADELGDILLKWDADYIIPVPLHRIKQAERGFNQSYYIARGISRVTGIPVKNYLRRKKITLSQTKMNISEREENIRDAFSVRRKSLIKDKTILLVDDVITTGSTINECGRMLLSAGAFKIYAVSAAAAELELSKSAEDLFMEISA